MERLKKAFDGINGVLYADKGCRRCEVCKCNATIEIREKTVEIPLLNSSSKLKRYYISIAISKDMEFS